MITLDGREVKVGDRLWSIPDGWVTVEALEGGGYPIVTERRTYTTTGKMWKSDRASVLFWDEVKIDPPPPPKRKVKKYQWLISNAAYNAPAVIMESMTEERARMIYGGRVIRPIEETMIEVEE